jgi:AcrR family transcriptional regulator
MAGQPSLREAQKQLTHSRLLDAAAESFAARGYAATKIEDIATNAGATRATFYLHFPSKRDVALGLRDELIGFAPDYAELALGADAREWLQRYVERQDDQRVYVLALQDAAHADPAIGAALGDAEHRSVQRLAEALVESRGWDRDEAEVIAAVLHHQLTVTTDQWIPARSECARALLLDTLARMWSAALTGAPVAAGVH